MTYVIKRLLAPAMVLLLGAACTHAANADYANPQLLTSTEQLDRMLDQPGVRVVDVRPKADFDKGHIEGAVHLGADDIIDPNSHIEGDLLPHDEIVGMLEARGIDRNTPVVFYDDKGGFHAARLFWMLEYFGHRKASVLNGGFPKWQKEGRPVSTKPTRYQRTEFTLTAIPRRMASADWLLDRSGNSNVVVIDVRPTKAYDAGHIPWARNIPWKQNLAADGTLKPADVLLAHFESQGVTKDKNVAVHCQVGKAAAHSYLALRLLGYPRIRSYDRSWAEWGNADDLPRAEKSKS